MRLIWITVIILISYGSLYPFNFDFTRDLPADLIGWLGNWEQRTIRSDLIANILLFMPYGFFGALNIQQDKRRSPLLSALWLILSGVAFALLLQLLQFFLPTRVPHAADALVNSVGILLGISMAAYTNSQRLRRLIPQKFQFQLIPALLVLTLWLGWAFFPYIPVFEAKQIGLGIESVYQSHWQWQLWFKYVLFWLVFYASFSRVMGRAYPLSFFLILSIFILVIKLTMLRSQLGWSEVTAVPVAVLLQQYLSNHSRLLLILIMAVMVLFIKFLWPWQWIGEATSLNNVQWIPFKTFLGGSTWYHLSNLLEYSLLLGSIVYALARWQKSYVKSAVTIFIIVLLFSILQLFVANKSPDITNLIMVIIIGFLFERIDYIRQ